MKEFQNCITSTETTPGKAINRADRAQASWLSWFTLDFYGGGVAILPRLKEALASGVMRGKEILGHAGTKAGLGPLKVTIDSETALGLFSDASISFAAWENFSRKLRIGVLCDFPSATVCMPKAQFGFRRSNPFELKKFEAQDQCDIRAIEKFQLP